MDLKKFWSLLKETFHEWHNDHVNLLAGAISFYMVFSLVPILVLAIAVFGQVLGEPQAHAEIIRQIDVYFSSRAASAVEGLLRGASKFSLGWTSVFSGVFLLVIALQVFSQLQDALKIIWRVEKQTAGVIKTLLKKRILAFIMLVGFGVFMFLSFFLDIMLQFLSASVLEWIPQIDGLLLWKILSTLVSLVLFSVLFSLIYRFIPRTQVLWQDVWLGSIVSAIMLIVSRYVLTFFFRWSNVVSLYGAAGSIIVVLLWIYFSAQIFLFGAELSYVYAHHYGSRSQES